MFDHVYSPGNDIPLVKQAITRQKVVGNNHIIHAPIAPIGSLCHAGQHSLMLSPVLGETIDVFFPPEAKIIQNNIGYCHYS